MHKNTNRQPGAIKEGLLFIKYTYNHLLITAFEECSLTFPEKMKNTADVSD